MLISNQGAYNSNVFINCPFDDGYESLFQAIVFTVIYCGFIPRCAKERSDDGEVRIHEIYAMILDCRYGIHDISYAREDPKTKLARFNMPYELGLFIGCKKFGNKEQKRKSCRILEKKANSYDKFLSDIGGQDIRAHNNNPQDASKHVRDFLSEKTKRITIPSPSIVWKGYQLYMRQAPRMALNLKLKMVELMYTWVSSNKGI